ncbi:hypothetical protein [Iningainema tapete]|uniref:Uncharacterized protein n=1 Tax=Iningainema tapete BLCC-T55 TaxID=2748662 RepID=A0A8J6XSM9_9CYAN|nr:hypothetical protein [Iningainema tapete]MBD2775852.1 hypothetical protein [Iningainema tapete BLCC-T55]
MNTQSIQRIIKLIEALSQEDQALLFDQLHQRILDKQHQENLHPYATDNPWIRLAGKYQDDPDYDEVLAYIQEYRRELDAEAQAR